MNPISRRNFLHSSAAVSAATFVLPQKLAKPSPPPAFANLKPLGDRVKPVTPDEFLARLTHAQELMSQSNPPFEALLIGPGTSLYYFTGIRWHLSERLLALLLPRNGQPVLICPAFEEARMRESLRIPLDVRLWQEDESPSGLLYFILNTRRIYSGRVGIEEALPFTFYDRFHAANPAVECVSADPITIACRARKSEHELALMRLACEATCDVYRAVFASLKEGMSQKDLADLIDAGYAKMNLTGEALTLIGPSAALPHGSREPRTLRAGDVVLIDGGCTIEGYWSDVTRTTIFGGKPTEKLQRAFDAIRKAQDTALDAARAEKLSGAVDDTARGVISSAGFGPGYKYFTHRLGHGIGLDGHEHPYLVRGSKTVLEPSMTFSNEPGVYIPGEFGVRCEDLMVIAPSGPAQLLTPGFQVSLEKPLG